MIRNLVGTSSKNFLPKNFWYLSVVSMLLVASLAGCANGKFDPFDRGTGKTQDEIKDAIYGDKHRKDASKKSAESASPKFAPVPQASRMIAIPSLPKASADKLISFSVTDQVPLKDVLIELAKAAKLDLDLDPSISGGVIVNAKNRPLAEVLDRVCEMGNLRYSLSNGRLHVERDLPFSKNYLVDFLIDGALWADVQTNLLAILQDNAGPSSGGSVTPNKLANIMTIYASQRNHLKVVSYLESVRKHASAQVLIEAKVIEVALNDSYKTGIDWSWLSSGETKLTQVAGGVDATNPITMVLDSKSLFGGGITSTVSALEEFGTVKAISSPRISALNNQKANLNFTQKLIYFTNDASTNNTTTSGTSNTQNTVTSTMHEEDTGTELAIVPSIDLINNEITLDVKPKITIKSGEVTQTLSVAVGTEGETKDLTNQIPIINTRELTTIAKIKSGSVLVIGGVMTEDTTNKDRGIPYLSRIPVLGYLFKSVSKVSTVTETVIFIKATIISTGDGANKYDRKINETFSSSGRPYFESKQ